MKTGVLKRERERKVTRLFLGRRFLRTYEDTDLRFKTVIVDACD